MKVLILTHGRLAQELLAAAEVIAGEMEGFEALCLEWTDGFDQAQGKLRHTLDRLGDGTGVLILTDMFGGTPYNVARTFLDPERVEIVTGVNLPMVLRLGCGMGVQKDLARVAHWVQGKGQSSICVSSDMKDIKGGC